MDFLRRTHVTQWLAAIVQKDKVLARMLTRRLQASCKGVHPYIGE